MVREIKVNPPGKTRKKEDLIPPEVESKDWKRKLKYERENRKNGKLRYL